MGSRREMKKYKKSYKKRELIVFDLDGTLTESKADLASWMSKLLCRLLEKKKVAVIGGGSYKQFQKQFLGIILLLAISCHYLDQFFL